MYIFGIIAKILSSVNVLFEKNMKKFNYSEQYSQNRLFQGFHFANIGFLPKKFSKIHPFQQAECLYFMKIALALNRK